MPDPHDTSALEAAIVADHAGTATEMQKSLLIMSTDSAGQRRYCEKWGWPFPGDSK